MVRIDPDGGRRTSETGDVRLSHVGVVGRRARATVATYIDRDRARLPDDAFGGVYVEFSNGGRRSVGIANSKTGAESLRVWVGRHGEELHHADYDGRYWVGTFSQRMQRAPKPSELRVRVVDTRAENPRAIDTGCSTGFVASIDRFVKE